MCECVRETQTDLSPPQVPSALTRGHWIQPSSSWLHGPAHTWRERERERERVYVCVFQKQDVLTTMISKDFPFYVLDRIFRVAQVCRDAAGKDVAFITP